MSKRSRVVIFIIVILALTACTPSPLQTPQATATATPPPSAAHLVISEVMVGIQGNNNHEFIELYNPSDRPVDLKGWSLWYRLSDDQDERRLYRWNERTLIPPNGHYLLVRSGEDLGITPDAEFDQPLVPTRGGIRLSAADKSIVDSLAWGTGPTDYIEGDPAPKLANNTSLERVPGGPAGNMIDSDNNATNFRNNPQPNPQNSGSPPTPTTDTRLILQLSAPATVEPGQSFEYTLTIHNLTGQTITAASLELPIPNELSIDSLPEFFEVKDHTLFWHLEELAKDETRSVEFTVTAPWTYLTILTHSYFVQTDDGTFFTLGGPVRTEITGGLIPIRTARTLIGAQMTIQGTATMYTGGYYAGSGNTKFYLQDETGGVQVWVPSGEGKVNIPLGAQVRVRGRMEVYRGAMEFIPDTPEDVVILQPPSADSLWQPTRVTIPQASSDKDTLLGSLITLEGTITRMDEFAYSYEIDLVDQEGNSLTAYIDKRTGITIETITPGQTYQVTGILEVRDTRLLFYPRLPSDLQEVFPQVLWIEADAPTTVNPGEVITVSLIVRNYTPQPLTNVQVTIPVPRGVALLDSILDNGTLADEVITWQIAELPADGGSAEVRYLARITGEEGYLLIDGYQATATEWPEPSTGEPTYTFVGNSVPIWAIQGPGFRSPFVLDSLTTAGVVTGVFPELEGFWIQEIETDDDPRTSAGIFINTGELVPPVSLGDYVEVTGVVREAYQQTQIQISDLANIRILAPANELPEAFELDPPVSEDTSEIYYEALEGMLVQVTGPALAVAPTSKYGEYVLVLPYQNLTRLWQGSETGMAIMVDDGAYGVNYDRSNLEYVIQTGDLVSGLLGPLAYTYGNYKIEPLEPPLVDTQETEPPSLPPTANDEFRLMTWNVENLFDYKDPHPYSPPRPSVAEYKLALTKVANTILAAGAPTIVGLQEVENIDILKDLAEHELLVDYNYQPILIEGTDSRGIDVGYLVRGDQAEILATEQHVAPAGLTSRPPLEIQVKITTDQGTLILYVINNHFTSMSGGEAATEPRRNAQAAWNVTILEGILAEDPEAPVAILGDLNSYYDSLPLDTLRRAGLKHVFELLPEEERYTYIYQGVSQSLDHLLVTPSLWALLRQVTVLHLDADYPPPEPGDTSPLHKSDHDPVIATFSLEP